MISEIITKQIEKLKGAENTKKETILIIDDLDRLDPEHIFRLLNIFSAHCDVQYYTEESTSRKHNKFNFDKIIFVCDVENLRSLFHHRYGAEANFVGYLDKFYSGEVFDYNSRMEMIKYVEENIEHIFTDFEDFVIPWFVDISPKYEPDQSTKHICQYHIQDNFLKPFLLDFLKSFIETGELNFRQIQSINRINLNEIIKEKLKHNDNKLSIIRLLLSVLISISGSAENLKTSFNKLATEEVYTYFHNNLDATSSQNPLENDMYKILFLLTLVDFKLDIYHIYKNIDNSFGSENLNKFNRKRYLNTTSLLVLNAIKHEQKISLPDGETITIHCLFINEQDWSAYPVRQMNYFALMAKVLEDLQAQKLL